MIDGSKKENFTCISLCALQKNKIHNKVVQEESLFNENMSNSSNILELFDFLSSNLDNGENIESCLLEILKVINNDDNTDTSNNYFEPLLIILQNYSDYSCLSIDTVLQIIYNLITIPSSKKKDYFFFFSQPIFLKNYFNLFTLSSQSIKIITEIIRKKNQVLDNYEEQIKLKIQEAPPSEYLIIFLTRCFKVNPEFIPIQQISLKLDEIMKSEIDESLFCSTAEFICRIIKDNEDSIDFFANNSIFYFKSNNDDIDNISILKIFTEIVQTTKNFSFLYIGSNEIFTDFLLYVLNNCKSNDCILSPLLQFLSYEADVSCFIENSQIIITCLKKIDNFSFSDKKKLMNFILNLVIQGNKEQLELSIKYDIMKFLLIFLENFTDKKMTMKILNVIGLIIENSEASLPFETWECIEKLMSSENEEISTLSSVVYQKMIQKVETKT